VDCNPSLSLRATPIDRPLPQRTLGARRITEIEAQQGTKVHEVPQLGLESGRWGMREEGGRSRHLCESRTSAGGC
jgi:hypothetical protein